MKFNQSFEKSKQGHKDRELSQAEDDSMEEGAKVRDVYSPSTCKFFGGAGPTV